MNEFTHTPPEERPTYGYVTNELFNSDLDFVHMIFVGRQCLIEIGTNRMCCR